MINTRAATFLSSVLLFAIVTSAIAQRTPQPVAEEAKLIAVLQSKAEFRVKADACRKLTRIATAKAVPVLAALLADEKLSHMARYALEPMQDPAVDAALRDALGKLDGQARVGVIGSIGMRRDATATAALAKLLGGNDTAASEAAARALGRIATSEAIEALKTAGPLVPSSSRPAVHEGLLRCADVLMAAGQATQAQGLYDRLRKLPEASPQVHAAALRGTVLCRGKEGIPLLREALRGSDLSQARAATRTALEMADPGVANVLADDLLKLPADRQRLVVSVLGQCGNASALPALIELAKTGRTDLRVAAIQAIAEINDATATATLSVLWSSPEKAVAQAALSALASLSGPAVDTAILNLLRDEDAETRKVAIDLIEQRRMLSAIPALLKTVADNDKDVRAAGIKTLGKLAGPAEFPTLVDLLAAATAPEEIRALEGALSGICTREARPSAGNVVILKAVYGDLPDGVSADVTKKVAAIVAAGSLLIEASNSNFGDPIHGTRKKMRVEYIADGVNRTKTVNESETVLILAGAAPLPLIEKLIGALPGATPGAKLALLRVLRAARGPEALTAVRQATESTDSKVRDEAIALLCGWPTVAALPHINALAKTSQDKRAKILAIRGCFRLIPLQDTSSAKKVAALRDVLAQVERTEEKQLALAAFAALPTRASLQATAPYLEVPELQQEAVLAVLAIAEKVAESSPTEIAAILPKLTSVKVGKDTAQRIASLAERVAEAVNPVGFEPIFDGKTLAGWEGNSEFWSIQDGAITGQTTKENPTKGNTFLIWRGGILKDFELRIRFRIAAHNSGIQYRSAHFGNFVVGGYQADIDASSRYVGIIYEERGRGIIVPRTKNVVIHADGKRESAGTTCDEKELLASLNKGGWNEYIITARGNHLIQKVNGHVTAELTDNEEAKRRLEGILALQLHAGPPMLVQFKDIRLKHLD